MTVLPESFGQCVTWQCGVRAFAGESADSVAYELLPVTTLPTSLGQRGSQRVREEPKMRCPIADGVVSEIRPVHQFTALSESSGL